MKNRTFRNLVTVVALVTAVTLLTGCEKKDIRPVDPELAMGYWEITAQSMFIKITASRDGGHKAEYLIGRGVTQKVGYLNTHTIIVSCTDAGGIPNSANGCAFTVNGNFYNKSTRFQRGVN